MVAGILCPAGRNCSLVWPESHCHFKSEKNEFMSVNKRVYDFHGSDADWTSALNISIFVTSVYTQLETLRKFSVCCISKTLKHKVGS